jgi:hypothetical protein
MQLRTVVVPTPRYIFSSFHCTPLVTLHLIFHPLVSWLFLVHHRCLSKRRTMIGVPYPRPWPSPLPGFLFFRPCGCHLLPVSTMCLLPSAFIYASEISIHCAPKLLMALLSDLQIKHIHGRKQTASMRGNDLTAIISGDFPPRLPKEESSEEKVQSDSLSSAREDLVEFL